MTVGRPPKPIERARMTGNPGHKKLPTNTAEVVALPPRSPVPGHLGTAGSALFQLILTACAGWLGQGDQAIVVQLCESADRRAKLLRRVEDEGDVLYTDKGYAYPHPAVGMISGLDAQMTKWYSLLGLTPTDRAKLGLVEVKTVSKLDQLRNERAAR